nr:MAG TPA: hypothetical protein [Caudoviricetes sp.]
MKSIPTSNPYSHIRGNQSLYSVPLPISLC